MGYVAYRPVFYVVGDVNNFMTLFDEFLAFLSSEKTATAEGLFPSGLQLVVEPHTGVDLEEFKNGEHSLEEVEVRDPADKLPHEVFSVNPPNSLPEGRHALQTTLSFPNPDIVKVAITGGPLYRMRDRFENAGIGGGHIDPEGTPYRRFVRVTEANVTEGGDTELTNVWKEVLKGAKTMVVLDGEPDADSPAGSYIANMRSDPQFVWV